MCPLVLSMLNTVVKLGYYTTDDGVYRLFLSLVGFNSVSVDVRLVSSEERKGMANLSTCSRLTNCCISSQDVAMQQASKCDVIGSLRACADATGKKQNESFQMYIF